MAYKRYIPLTAILSLIYAIPTFGQLDYNQAMDSYFNSQKMMENHFRSVTIYADFAENDIRKGVSFGGKIAELEFDERGNQIYLLTGKNHSDLPIIGFGKGDRIHIDSFDVKNNRISSYTENQYYSTEGICKYDKNGNVISEEFKSNNELIIKTTFTWSDGKMIQAKNSFSNDANKDGKNEYDTERRILKHSSANFRMEYTYQSQGDTLITKRVTYRADTLLSTEVFSTLNNTNRLTQYTRRDHKNKLALEMKANYDVHGNATSYYLNDLTERYDGEKYPPKSLTIENVYNDKGLLVKRLYYDHREHEKTAILIKIERYFYETNSLPFKIKKGGLMYYENEYMDYDGE
jgi:hypothetical protein